MESGCGQNNKGFSLLELVITIAILSIGIVSILQAFSFAVQMTGLSGDIIEGTFLAEDKVQELEFKEKQNLINIAPREEQGRKNKFTWKYTLNLNPEFKLTRLNLNVTWRRAKREENLNFDTYLR